MSDQDIPVSTAIDEFVASLPAGDTLTQRPPNMAPPSTSGAATSPQAAPEAPKTAQETPKEPDADGKYARGFARLAAKEQALAARERELETKVAEAQKTSEASVLGRLKANPIRFFNELGLTKDQIAHLGRAALGASLDNAPEQYRELADKLRLDEKNEDVKSELQKLREEIAAEKAKAQEEARAQAFREEYHGQLTKYVSAQELSTEAPNVARLYSADPEGTIRRMYAVIAQDATAKMRSGGHGAPLTPSEAAKALEQELSVYAKTFGSTSTPQNERAPSAPVRKTLSDSQVNPAPTDRSLPDPEKDWSGWKKAQEEAWLAEQSRRGA